MDWTLIIPIGLLLFALLLFVIIYNRKKRPFTEDVLNDYPAPRIEEHHIRVEDDSHLYQAAKKKF